jgi:uncharacterized protein YkwD
MRNLILMIIGFYAITLNAQTVNDTINPNAFNQQLMEKAVLQKVNSYRTANGKTALVYNAVVYKVAKDHTEFLKTADELTHEQPNPKKKSVRDRFKYHTKLSNFVVGENLAQTSVLIPTYNYNNSGEVEKSIAYTYQEAATYMFYAWKQSSFHNQNMLSDKYQMSAVSTYFNPENKSVIGVQVFAKVGG